MIFIECIFNVGIFIFHLTHSTILYSVINFVFCFFFFFYATFSTSLQAEYLNKNDNYV